MPPPSLKPLLVALSGPSCSGKTTLARLLRDALSPHAFIIHEDDFYVTDSQIPIKKVSDGRELQDWDCFESIDFKAMKEMVAHVKEHGVVKEGFESIQDGNAVGEVQVDGNVIANWKAKFKALCDEKPGKELRICIVDGFLLFSDAMKEVRELFDIRLLLRADYETVKSRREARSGYVTLEGFWEDPEGYVDEIVWPNYVADHAFLFQGDDVEGEPDLAVISRLSIDVARKEAVDDMTICFEWAAEKLKRAIWEGREEQR